MGKPKTAPAEPALPQAGGSYIRNPDTGELVRQPDPEPETAPADAGVVIPAQE